MPSVPSPSFMKGARDVTERSLRTARAARLAGRPGRPGRDRQWKTTAGARRTPGSAACFPAGSVAPRTAAATGHPFGIRPGCACDRWSPCRPRRARTCSGPELAGPAGGQRRELLTAGNGLAPRLQHRRKVARCVRVDPHLVEIPGAEVAAAERLHERSGDHDVGLLLDDQIPPAGQLLQPGVLRHRVAHRRTMLQVLVRPGVDDLIERAEVGMPEGTELRVLFPQRLALGKAVLEFGHGPGAQRVGSNFVNHGSLLIPATYPRTCCSVKAVLCGAVLCGAARIRAATRRQPASDSIARTSSAASDRSRLARACFMCSALEVPVSGSIPTAWAKRNTTWAGVAPRRAAMPVTSRWRSTSGLAVSSEKPW